MMCSAMGQLEYIFQSFICCALKKNQKMVCDVFSLFILKISGEEV